MNEEQLDQTTFSDLAPLREEVDLPHPEIAPQTQAAPSKPKKNPLLLVGVIAGVIVIASLGLAVLASPKTGKPQTTTENTPEPSATTSTQHPLQKDIERLEKDVKAADPDLTGVPFPPVNMQLRLQDANNRKNQ